MRIDTKEIILNKFQIKLSCGENLDNEYIILL